MKPTHPQVKSTHPQPDLQPGHEEGPANVRKVREWIQAHTGEGPITLTLPPGIFHFHNPEGDQEMERLMDGKTDARSGPFRKNPVFEFQNVRGISIAGQETALVFDGLIQPFFFRHCHEVTVRGLSVDWGRPGFSEGEVVAGGPGWLDVEIDPAYPLKGGEPVVSFQDFDPACGRLAGTCPFFGIAPLELVRPGVVRVRHEFCDRVVKGHRIVLRHLYNFSPAIELFDCHNTRLHDLRLLAHPGPGVIGTLSENIEFRRFRVEPAPGRIMSTNVDATHFASCYGLLDFENCYFEGMGDDAMNAHGYYHFAEERAGKKSILSKIGDSTALAYVPGDRIEWVRRSTFETYAQSVIAKVTPGEGTDQPAVIEMTEPLPDELHTGPKAVHVGHGRVPLEKASPEAAMDGDLFVNASRLPKIRFIRCTARNLRGRGILVQSRGVLVEDCRFDHCTGQGVHVDTAAGWWESIGTRDVVIRNNTFIGCGYGTQTYCSAAGIVVETECEQPAPGVHRDLIIEHNYIDARGDIHRHPARGILLTCTTGAQVTGNDIRHCDPAIEIGHAREITLADNQLDGGRIVFCSPNLPRITPYSPF